MTTSPNLDTVNSISLNILYTQSWHCIQENRQPYIFRRYAHCTTVLVWLPEFDLWPLSMESVISELSRVSYLSHLFSVTWFQPFLHLTVQDYPQAPCFFNSAHKILSWFSFQSESSFTSCLTVLFFRVLFNGPVTKYINYMIAEQWFYYKLNLNSIPATWFFHGFCQIWYNTLKQDMTASLHILKTVTHSHPHIWHYTTKATDKV
jgi:hypothetical protein